MPHVRALPLALVLLMLPACDNATKSPPDEEGTAPAEAGMETLQEVASGIDSDVETPNISDLVDTRAAASEGSLIERLAPADRAIVAEAFRTAVLVEQSSESLKYEITLADDRGAPTVGYVWVVKVEGTWKVRFAP